jgi:two-component system sensor histidine kinase AlgZ
MDTPSKNQTTETQAKEIFLPDFCNVRIVFSVIVIAELVAFVMALATPSSRGGGWSHLGLLSLYIQWIALCSTAALCTLRPHLAKLNNSNAAISAYGLLILITLIFSETTYWVSHNFAANTLTISMDHWEFLGRNLAICAIASFLTLRYFFLQFQLKRNIEAENQYRLQALQARIRPHFLFNSLNSIASLIRRQPERAEEAVEDLADLFRHTLNDAQATVTLSSEIEIAKRYLHMEQLRLGERLNVEWALGDTPLDATLPALTLQPLFENAIHHGIERLAEGGIIRCEGKLDRKYIRITISNTLVAETNAEPHTGLHMAVDNIRQRLQFHFKEQGRLNTKKNSQYYQVEIGFPYKPLTTP